MRSLPNENVAEQATRDKRSAIANLVRLEFFDERGETGAVEYRRREDLDVPAPALELATVVGARKTNQRKAA
ncbi:MAG TPA: hypothetical protein VJ783_16285 [Pirellulales bacterium]|nr:hypothetical protein [Pirellulales bacterium]